MQPSPACWPAGPSRMCRSKASTSAAGCGRFRSPRWRSPRRSQAPRPWSVPVGPPAFASIIGAKSERARDPLALTLGVLLIVLTVLAVQSALALSFDPRYRDFPFAPLTAAALPFLLLSFVAAPVAGARSLAETIGGCGARAVRGIHRLERDARQLAGAVVCRGAGSGRVQLASGTGRARLRISSATASADSAVL